MKKIGTLMLLLLILLAVTACGNTKKETVDTNRLSLLKEAEYYIRMVELGKEDEAKSSPDNIRKNAEGEDKERFLELADLMEQGDLDKVRSLHAELGGEYIAPKTSSVGNANEKNDRFAVLSLEAAQLYIESDAPTSKENRKDIADLINKNSLNLTDDEKEDFSKLAGLISNDDMSKAKDLYQELNEKYGR